MFDKKAVTPAKPAAYSAVKKAVAASTNDKKEITGATFSQLKAFGSAVSKKSVRLTWSSVKGANKYLIYGTRCGSKKKLKKLASVKTLTWKYKKCETGKHYKFVVIAMKGKKVFAISPKIHVVSKGGKYTMPPE